MVQCSKYHDQQKHDMVIGYILHLLLHNKFINVYLIILKWRKKE